jgi:uncharacterized protein YuzE
MNEKIKAHVIAYAEKQGYGTDNDTLYEIIREGKQVYSEIGSSHRWYDEMFIVTEVDGMLIGFDWFHVTGDTSISDMGLDFEPDSICEVEAKEVTKIVYTKLK